MTTSIARRAGAFARALTLTLALASVACEPEVEPFQVHLAAGDGALAEGRYPRALAAYKKALELAPTDSRVQLAAMRGRAFLIADQAARVELGALEDMRYELDFLLAHDAQHAAAYHVALGNVALRLGNAAEAKAKYEDALKADAGSALAHTALASLAMKDKDGAAIAKRELEAALKSSPGHASALVAVAQLALAEGDANGAADKLVAATRTLEDSGIHLLLASARRAQKKNDEAIAELRRARALDPQSPDILVQLGQALSSEGQLDEAEHVLRTALSIQKNGQALLALGFTLTRAKRPAEALGVFSELLANNPTEPTALLGAGAAAEALGKSDQALDAYQRLLALPLEDERSGQAELRKEAQSRVAELLDAKAKAAEAAEAAGKKKGAKLSDTR